ncbi:MAG: ATP-binding protein [bacterium]
MKYEEALELPKIKLLIVEDDLDFNYSLASRLRKRNFEVVVAFTVKEALDILKHIDFDAIVSDIKLPEIDGITFLTRVREIAKDLPVIILTGYGSLESAKQAIKLHASDYLLKPLEHIDDLFDSINKAVHSYHLIIKNKQLMSELKGKVKELESSKQKYKNLFHLANNIIYIADTSGNIISVNKKMESTTHYTQEELLGIPAKELVDPLEQQLLQKKFQEAVTLKKIIDMVEITINTKDGQPIVGELSMRPIEEEGLVTGVHCIVHDISDRKQIERELISYKEDLEKMVAQRTQEATKAKLQAEKSNRVKSEFLTNISHELRTPLHGILSFAKFGIEKIESAPKEKLVNYFKQIHENGQRLLGFVNNLLDVSKLESGNTHYSFKHESLSNLIICVQNELSAMLKEKGICIDFKKAGFDDTAIIDRDKILQVMRNILANAIKFSESHSTIYINIEERKKDFTLSFIDRGIGIPESELEKIFDKFAQSSISKTGAGGTGLGLSISKQIILDHRGKIWAENNPDGGAIIKFVIPKRQQQNKKLGRLLVKNGLITEEQLVPCPVSFDSNFGS